MGWRLGWLVFVFFEKYFDWLECLMAIERQQELVLVVLGVLQFLADCFAFFCHPGPAFVWGLHLAFFDVAIRAMNQRSTTGSYRSILLLPMAHGFPGFFSASRFVSLLKTCDVAKWIRGQVFLRRCAGVAGAQSRRRVEGNRRCMGNSLRCFLTLDFFGVSWRKHQTTLQRSQNDGLLRQEALCAVVGILTQAGRSS